MTISASSTANTTTGQSNLFLFHSKYFGILASSLSPSYSFPSVFLLIIAPPDPDQASLMAGTVGQDELVLQRHLEDHFQVAPPEYWNEVQTSFQTLKKLLAAQSSNDEDSNNKSPNGQDDDEIPSARLARIGALPKLVAFATGTHALKLTATNESLECVVFGTISSKLFVNVFWESILSAQATVPIFASACEHNSFHLYVHLVFLASLGLVIQEHSPDDVTVDTRPALRLTYHYIRAWATVQGLYGSFPAGGLTPLAILELLRSATSSESEDYRLGACISRFFTYYTENSDLEALLSSPGSVPSVDEHSQEIINHKLQALATEITNVPKDGNASYWQALLTEMEHQPLVERIESSHIIEIKLLYSGTSFNECHQWLAMVKSRLADLRKALLDITNPSPRIHVWPQQFVPASASDTDPVYEGCYLIGLSPPYSSAPPNTTPPFSSSTSISITNTIKTFESDLQKASTEYSQSYVFIHLHSTTESHPHLEHLRPCTKTWNLPDVEPPFPQSQSQASSTSAGPIPRRPIHPSTTPSSFTQTTNTSLRPAKDILSRLRHDPQYDIERYVIGYIDRHSEGLKRKNAGDWARDTTDEDWIPEHRIVYFAEKGAPDGVYVWDREGRVDGIFGSGRGGVRS
ncbi:DUF455 domain protein [Rutstroemia sp. NJR-2017a BVV2]|nr:DUF455 domain protein [Rutstroemia sp. NJR-2017a BVV2]